MRTLLCKILMCVLVCAAMSDQLDAQVFAKSPEVNDDRTITFRYFAPKAESVVLRGNVPEIKGEMTKDEKGIWSITVGPVEPNSYPYKFIVDKAAVLDPVNRSTKAWLWMDNLVHVPADTKSGETPPIHQMQDVPHGSVHIHWYLSETLKKRRRMFVYTPPGYDDDEQQYPVLYLLHGFGDDESAWTRVGLANHIADNVFAAKKAKPCIIVMPSGHKELPESPDYSKYALMDNLQTMEKELLEGIIPFIEKRYRCRQEPKGRAIAGLSMGGGHALYFGINNLDKFGSVAGFSSSIYQQMVPEMATAKLAELKNKKPWIWVGCGKDDFLFKDTVKFDKWLTDNGVEHQTLITEGAHNWRCWRPYLSEILGELF